MTDTVPKNDTGLAAPLLPQKENRCIVKLEFSGPQAAEGKNCLEHAVVELTRAMGVFFADVTELPQWAFHKDVASLQDEYPFPIPLNFTTGPALWWSRRALPLMLASSAAIFFWVWTYQHTSWIIQPWGSWFLAFWMFLVSSFGCFMQHRALKYAILPFAKQAKTFQVLSLHVPYQVWYLAEMVMSLMTMVTFHTNAIFFGKAWTDNQNIPMAWTTLMNDSFLGVIPIWEHVTPNIIIGLFLLSFFIPALVCLADTEQMPQCLWDDHMKKEEKFIWGERQSDISNRQNDDKDQPKFWYSVSYQQQQGTTWGEEIRWTVWTQRFNAWKMTFSEALFAQSTNTGWCAFRQMSLSYPLSRLNGITTELEAIEKQPDFDKKFPQKCPDWASKTLRKIRSLKQCGTMGNYMLLFTTLPRCALQVNFQVTLSWLQAGLGLGLDDARSTEPITLQFPSLWHLMPMINLIMTSLAFECDLFWSIVYRHYYTTLRKDEILQAFLAAPPPRQAAPPPPPKTCPYHGCGLSKKADDECCDLHYNLNLIRKEYNAFGCQIMCMSLLFALCNALILYAFVKILMYWWNGNCCIGWNISGGCVYASELNVSNFTVPSDCPSHNV